MNRAEASNPSLFTVFMRLEGQDALKFGFTVIAKIHFPEQHATK